MNFKPKILTPEHAYIRTYDPKLPCMPRLAAISQMRVGDEVVTWLNGENATNIRKIIKIKKIRDGGWPTTLVTLDEGLKNLRPLKNLHATLAVPLKHGLFLEFISQI